MIHKFVHLMAFLQKPRTMSFQHNICRVLPLVASPCQKAAILTPANTGKMRQKELPNRHFHRAVSPSPCANAVLKTIQKGFNAPVSCPFHLFQGEKRECLGLV